MVGFEGTRRGFSRREGCRWCEIGIEKSDIPRIPWLPLVLDIKRRCVERLKGRTGLLAKMTSSALVAVAHLLRVSFGSGLALAGCAAKADLSRRPYSATK